MSVSHRTIAIFAAGSSVLLAILVLLFAVGNRASSSYPMPDELYNNNARLGSGLFANTDLEMSWVGFDSHTRKVLITRNRRQNPAIGYGPADVSKQLLSAAFDISSIAVGIDPPPTIDSIYVAGTDPATGSTHIERWKFTYGAGGAAALGSGPTETRYTLYSGTSIGCIRSIDVDPLQRYLLILTFDRSVYRLDVPAISTSGSGGPPPPPSLVADATTIPSLANAWELNHYMHQTDGNMFLATSLSPSDDTVVFPDADDDGVLETVQVFTETQWESSGYSVLDNYVPLFKTEWFPAPFPL